MPELPEVETVVRGLNNKIINRIIFKIQTSNHKLRLAYPKNFAEQLINQKIIKVWRRAKYIICQLSNDVCLIMHLGMSGKINIGVQNDNLPKHTHFTLHLDNGESLYFNDPRRFGLITTCEYSKLFEHKLLAHMGAEPLTEELTIDYLLEKFKTRNGPIKTTLMDNKIIVGVGNIYASESLFLARISPLLPAKQLTKVQLTKLILAIKSTLEKAIKLGGSTLKDYRNAEDNKGYFQNEFNVYGRDQQNCLLCNEIIVKLNQAGRATYYCIKCQK